MKININIMEIYHIFIILINIFFVNSNDIISIPFYKDLPNLNGLSPEQVSYKIKENTLLSEINLGTPSQKILLKLVLADYIFYIGGKSSHFHNKFIETDSKTYKKVSEKTIYFTISNIKEGLFSSDNFYFNENPNDKREINFILGIDTDKGNEGGLIGLNIQDIDTKKYEKYNFINILKNKRYIKDYYFTIKYNDNSNSGNLIIGDLPHNYNNSYNIKYFKDTYISMFTDVLTWNINLDSIYVADNALSENKKIIGERIYGYFKIEQGMILGTERYREYILNNFMTENIDKKLCFEVKSTFYFSYYCKKEVDLSKFKSLFIYIKELGFTFELTYNDLFYSNNDGNNYFLVYFNTEYNEEEEYSNSFFWVFGEPFLKKYNLVFNQETKRIGLYTNMNFGNDNNNNDDEDNSENKSFWARNKWYIILIIILIIVCAGLGFMIFLYKKVLPKRKKCANELDDEFDYSSKDKYIINY